MSKFEIIFSPDKEKPNEINRIFKPEAIALEKLGIKVGLQPSEETEKLLYRGTMLFNKSDYPKDKRYIQGWEEYISMSRLSIYFPLIEDISIPTFFSPKLDEMVENEIKNRGWEAGFIKNDVKSLWGIDEYASVYPNHSLAEIEDGLKYYPFKDMPFAIRKFIDPNVFLDEDRYWVINGKIYYRNNNIPDVVREAQRRLDKLGSKYYAIDATPNFIVEVNPGESSDRYGVNPPELFASWFKDAFNL